MSETDHELEAILRAGSKSFHLASRLLPRRVRPATFALYAFCRHADDAVDDASTDGDARRAVDSLRSRIDRVYGGVPSNAVVERAFATVMDCYEIPRAIPDALVEGMEWDACGRTYVTASDVRAYGVRVAGTVGLMMTMVMGRRCPTVLAHACDLGVAMQLTNIARDVGEDARRGRIYLPQEWLDQEGVDAEAFLRNPTATRSIRRVVARLLAEADGLYSRADAGISHLPADCRIAIRAARLVYSAIGDRIRAADCDSVSQRAVVPLSHKLWLLLRAFGARSWRPQPLPRQASPEALPLLGSLTPLVAGAE